MHICHADAGAVSGAVIRRIPNNDVLVASYSTTRAASYRLIQKIHRRNTWQTMTSLWKTVLFLVL